MKQRKEFCELNAYAIGIDDKPFVVVKEENASEALIPFGRGGGLFATFGAPFELTEKQANLIVEDISKKGTKVKTVSKILWSRSQILSA